LPRPERIFRISIELTYELDGDGLSAKSRQFSILYVLIPILAVLTTLATGFWVRSTDGKLEYGFPLPWKTVEIIPSPLPPTSYNWSFFILDAAFYAAIGYAIVFIHTRRL